MQFMDSSFPRQKNYTNIFGAHWNARSSEGIIDTALIRTSLESVWISLSIHTKNIVIEDTISVKWRTKPSLQTWLLCSRLTFTILDLNTHIHIVEHAWLFYSSNNANIAEPYAWSAKALSWSTSPKIPGIARQRNSSSKIMEVHMISAGAEVFQWDQMRLSRMQLWII